MRQLATQRAFFQPTPEFAMNADSEGVDLSRLLLVAIERALSPPIAYRRNTLQPMRVIVVGPGLMSGNPEMDEADFEAPRVLPHALPAAAGLAHHPRSQFQYRPVQGEILSDENGGLYEKIGNLIRPIQQLASGPFGELIELTANAQANLRLIGPAAQPKIVKRIEAGNALLRRPPQSAANSESAGMRFVPVQRSTEEASVAGHRKLFADPGQWRVLLWGEFKEILSRQLAHPGRLRDTYRLPCYVQVFETERVITIEELMAAYKSQHEDQTQLYFLTEEVAAKLDLLSVLPARAAQPVNAQRAPNTLLPHDRVFRLLAANDPTVDVASAEPKLRSPASKNVTPSIASKDKVLDASIQNPALKQVIPSCYLKEWEVKISREEAAYDMSAKPTLFTAIRRLVRRLRIFKLRNEVRKWQVLLTGREADEQLWAVCPPAGFLDHPFVREWAAKMLEHAGYDGQTMITEWEIFWRRRGL